MTAACEAAGVSTSGYYDWCAREAAGPTERQLAEAELVALMRDLFDAADGNYGVPRMFKELRRAGLVVNRKRVHRLMRLHGMAGRHRRRTLRTTFPGPDGYQIPDLVGRRFEPGTPDVAWCQDIERHEALSNRAVVKGHRHAARRSGLVEAEGSLIPGTRGRVEAALTTTGRASTARWSGSGERDGKAYVRNQRLNASQEQTTSSNLADLGWVAARTRTATVGGTPWSVDVAGREATVKACGVAVARLQGHSWAPTPSNGSRVNVGTIPAVPSPASSLLVGGKARRRPMPSGWGGGPVVVRGRESRSHGEGVQRVRSINADRGGRR